MHAKISCFTVYRIQLLYATTNTTKSASRIEQWRDNVGIEYLPKLFRSVSRRQMPFGSFNAEPFNRKRDHEIV